MAATLSPDVSAPRFPDGYRDLPTVTSTEQLEAFGVPDPAVRDKVRDRLHPLDKDWLAASPLVFVGTASPDGRCDVSPKGDPAGIGHVLDEHTLVLPERAGNKRMDGFHNILANPHVGLVFVIPGRQDTLRVNGVAQLVTDGPFFDDLVVKGHRPLLALVVHVEEVFYHCPKALMRAKAWDPASWHPESVARYADVAKQLWRAGDDPAAVDEHYRDEKYAAELYPDLVSRP
ncbi:MSMEG_1061 family FMN-dependent PPOX-type flavoprotein [Flexivirga caeni]|uniref:Pyridoxamine 5'-phosphate oxidase family protein n=1 Tax=Flexivirga caeni TaxID=2294115 RepID=A0A3M9MCJ2_9MICO|nr:MSMEG_1061 family FMN-dependent PPOX-type flavoprotein [Flexivirga caeni]RNI23290.1 pyridoxamine 5'-phosphate oxidase family protein [Flexivirga caeni]